MKVVYQEIAKCFQAYLNNKGQLSKLQPFSEDFARVSEWLDKWEQEVIRLTNRYLPSGSGFDSGTKFLFDESKPEKLVFFTEFHHMNENGYYDGWTQHKLIIRPSLAYGFDVTVTGRDKNQIRDYILEQFNFALETEIPEPIECEAEKAELAMYLTGHSNYGSFKLAFYDMLFKADGNNLETISKAFPKHVEALSIYRKFGEGSPEFNSYKEILKNYKPSGI